MQQSAERGDGQTKQYENGEEKFAFDSVKNVYNFLAEQILKNKSKITIFPRLRKYREEWKVLEKDNHIPSNSEMN